MNVGYVLKTFPRLSQTFIVNELRAHERAGLQVTIFALKRPKPEDVACVIPPLASEVVYLDGPAEEWPGRLAAAARERHIDHFHAHFGNLATRVARAAAAKLGITYSFTAHALDIFDEKVDQEELAAKIRDASAVVTVSKFNVAYLRETFGRRASLVYNGMPLHELPFHRPRERSRTVVAVGRLIEKKGFDDLISACARLDRRGVDFRCEIVGDGPLLHELRRQILGQGLEDRVVLLGALPHEAVKDRLRGSALLAAPCVVAATGDRDGLPTVVLEAMALGTPCVATDVTGIPEVIRDGETGILLHQNDPAGLAAAIERLLDDEALAERLAVEARQLIEECFDSDITAAKLRALWDNPPPKILFRVHNRRGLGHLMRSLNIGREIEALAPHSDLVMYARNPPPFEVGTDAIWHQEAADAEQMGLDCSSLKAFQPDIVVDDTMLPSGGMDGHARRVLVMRKRSADKQRELFESPGLRDMNLVVVPHSEAEFGHEIPAWLKERCIFTGPIVRRPDPAAQGRLRARLGLATGAFVLVSTPGGGGFPEDAARLMEAVCGAHPALRRAIPNLHHILVRGPNSEVAATPVDDAMVVLDSEPDLVSLFALADAVVSAGGYNSVQEIRLTRRPAVFLPGSRKYDDQEERVRQLEQAGVARVLTEEDPRNMAAEIVRILSDGAELKRMRERYELDAFEPGNRAAAEAILQCLQR